MKPLLTFIVLCSFSVASAVDIPKNQAIGFLLPNGWYMYVSPDGSGGVYRYKPVYVFACSPKGVFDYETLRSSMNHALSGDTKFVSSKIMYILMDTDDSGGMDVAPDIPEIKKLIGDIEVFFSQKAVLDFPDVLRKTPIQQK